MEKNNMPEKPWTDGPVELLTHGLSHLQKESAFDARIAFISIDNAVELMIKIYIVLPDRETGRPKLKPEQYKEACRCFPNLTAALEAHASNKIVGINLTEIEWYHQMRNTLYHEGGNLSVEKKKAETYAGVAKTLMYNLFSVALPASVEESEYGALVGKFLLNWAKLEQEAARVYDKVVPRAPINIQSRQPVPLPAKHLALDKTVAELMCRGVVSGAFVTRFDTVRVVRNAIAHGQGNTTGEELKQHTGTLNCLLADLAKV